MQTRFSRRTAALTTIATGLATAAGIKSRTSTAAFAQTGTPASSPTTAGGWTFTDDRDVTVSLPQAPTRVIAQTSSAAALWDFGFKVVGYLGPNDPDNEAGFPQVGDMDVATLPNLGDYGAFDLEKAISLQPDLYVDLDRGGETLWYLDADTQSALEKVCPTVGLNAKGVPVIDIVRRYEDLAVALGTDANDPTLTEAKASHATAETDFRTATAAHPDLRVLTISTAGDGTVTLWNGAWLPDLIYFGAVGMTSVDVGVDAMTPNTEISMEALGQYEADVILVDVRNDITVLDGNAIWESLPAVQAGQVGRWYSAFPYSWQKLARVLDLTGATLSAAQSVN